MNNLSGVILVLGLVFIVGQLVPTIIRSRKRTANTTGVVVSVTWRWGSRVPHPDVEFLDREGIRHQFHSTAGASWNPWPVGARVNVSYDPNDPANAELALSETRPLLVFILIILGIIVGFAAFAAISAWR